MKGLSYAMPLFGVIFFVAEMKGTILGIRPCSLVLHQCTCTNESYQCSFPKDQLQEIPLDIPSTVTQVDLSGNLFSMVSNTSLRNLNRLRYLNLKKNLLSQVQEGAFTDLQSLETLDLSENFILELDAKHFYPLSKLQKLNITQNPNLNISINAFQNAPTLTEIMADKNFNAWTYDFSDLTELETIHLVDCKVRHFWKDNFRNLPNLRRLLMSGNELVDFPVSILKHLSSLEDLKLSGNFIRSIRNYNFSNNPKLAVLELSQNEIENLEGVYLNYLPALRRLDLTNNKIKMLAQDSLPNYPPSQSLSLLLRNNPLVCDCNLKWLPSRSKSNPSNKFDGRCEEPKNMVGREPWNMEKSDFLCPPWKLASSRLSHVVSISQAVTLTCPINGDPFPSITWYYHNQTTALNDLVDSRFVKSNDQGDRLYFKTVTLNRAGLYICSASNMAGSKNVSIALTVVPLPGTPGLPGTVSVSACSCRQPVILVLALSITIIVGIFAIFFFYRKYLKAARAQRNMAYATLNETEGETL